MAKKSVPPGRTDPTYSKHVRLYDWMMRSDAWQHLSHAARSLYIELERRHNGANNGDLHMSIREAADLLRCSKNHAHACFKELEAKGFIRPGQRGAFSLKQRHATTWILTTYGLPHDPRPTKEFMSWRPVGGAGVKQNPVPLEGTDGLTRRDRKTATVSPRGTDGLTTRDREAHQTVGDGLTTRDTTSLPQGAQPEGEHAPVLDGDQSSTPTSAAGRQPDPVEPAKPIPVKPPSDDDGQLDLEAAIAARGGQDLRPEPIELDELRAEMVAWLDDLAGHGLKRGGVTSLAHATGISRVHLSNFKSGREGLSPDNARKLKAALATRPFERSSDAA